MRWEIRDEWLGIQIDLDRWYRSKGVIKKGLPNETAFKRTQMQYRNQPFGDLGDLFQAKGTADAKAL